MFVYSLRVGALACLSAMVLAVDPTSMPSSMPTELQGWTYGETATGSACAGTTSDPCGTEHWGEVTGYETCSTGLEQSPINIAGAEPNYELRMPEFHITDDGCDEWVQKSIAGGFEVTVHDDHMSEACEHLYLDYEEHEYHFYNMQFHSPSEHSIAGGYYPGEVQLKHKTTDGDVLMLSILLEVSTVDELHPYNNTFLDRLWKAGGVNVAAGVTTHVDNQSLPLNPYDEFLPGNPAHFVYDGSLTTPPCTEHVKWLVFANPVRISTTDYMLLKQAISAGDNFVGSEHGSTNRYPTEELHGRHVYLYTDNTDEAEARLATIGSDDPEAEVDAVESMSVAAISLAALSLIFTIGSLVVVCSLKSTLDHVTARVIPR